MGDYGEAVGAEGAEPRSGTAEGGLSPHVFSFLSWRPTESASSQKMLSAKKPSHRVKLKAPCRTISAADVPTITPNSPGLAFHCRASES